MNSDLFLYFHIFSLLVNPQIIFNLFHLYSTYQYFNSNFHYFTSCPNYFLYFTTTLRSNLHLMVSSLSIIFIFHSAGFLTVFRCERVFTPPSLTDRISLVRSHTYHQLQDYFTFLLLSYSAFSYHLNSSTIYFLLLNLNQTSQILYFNQDLILTFYIFHNLNLNYSHSFYWDSFILTIVNENLLPVFLVTISPL